MAADHAHLGEAVSHLERLIAFPTVSVDSNLDLIEYAAALLEPIGATLTHTFDAARGKANLFATLGPCVDGGVVLSGHTDVVPVAGQKWHTPPFEAVLRDRRVYGRGACDMKGFIACALAMAPKLARRELTKPVHLALTFDEEIGCLGAPLLLDALTRNGPQPATAIVGEPTEMKIIEGHKGCYEYTTEIVGLEGHGSLPEQGANAVECGVRFVAKLLELGESLKGREPPTSPFTPPYSTLSVGSFHGGIARNVIARECAIEWEMRPVQGADADFVWAAVDRHVDEVLVPDMRSRHPQASIVTHTIGAIDGLEPMPASQAVALAHELTGGNARGVVSFGTEAGLFQEAGIPTVVCGPGSIEQAHRPDEYVQCTELSACLAMMERLGAKLSAPS